MFYLFLYGVVVYLCVPFPSELHFGTCKPVWPCGCEGESHCFFKTMLLFNLCLCHVCFLFLTRANSMLEFVNQSGHLVVRGEAIVVFKTVLLLLLLLLVVPYPSKLMLELLNQFGRLVVRGEAIVFYSQNVYLCFFSGAAALMQIAPTVQPESQNRKKTTPLNAAPKT